MTDTAERDLERSGVARLLGTDRPPSEQPRAAGGRVGLIVESLALPVFWIVLVVVFSLIEPQQYPTLTNFANILGTNSVLLVTTFGALLPLVVGDFDLSIGATVGLAAMVIALLNVQAHVPIVLSCVAGLAAGAAVGAVNAAIVVGFGGDTFIVTLATSTVVTGVVYWISGSQTISGVSSGLSQWTFLDTLGSIPVEFYYGVAFVVVLWYLYRWTSIGQQAICVGQSRRVARLSGIRVPRYRTLAFVLAGLLAGVAGILMAGTSSGADPTAGPDLLLPAFAAAFLGSTTIQPGRFNPLGAWIAVYFLASGVSGLQLLGAQNYVQDVFYGGALLVALGAGILLRRRREGRPSD